MGWNQLAENCRRVPHFSVESSSNQPTAALSNGIRSWSCTLMECDAWQIPPQLQSWKSGGGIRRKQRVGTGRWDRPEATPEVRLEAREA